MLNIYRSAAAVFLFTTLSSIAPAQGARDSGRRPSTPDVAATAAKQAQAQSLGSDAEKPVRSVPDPGVITTNQLITPAGLQSIFESRLYDVKFGENSSDVYVEADSKAGATIFQLNWRSNRVINTLVRASATPGLQGLAYDPAKKQIYMTAAEKSGVLLVQDWHQMPGDVPVPKVHTYLGAHEIASAALSHPPNGQLRYAVVALTFNDAIAILDADTGELIAKVRTGIAPFGVAIDSARQLAYIGNWGGRFPRPGDKTLAIGVHKNADQIVVDNRGVPISGTVTVVSLSDRKTVAEIEVGLHPTGLALDEKRGLLYVANGNSDTISIIDTTHNRVENTVEIQPFIRRVPGISPQAIALSHDGTLMYVACAGINAIAEFHLVNGVMKIKGLIPTGWYPDSVALSEDGKYVAVGALLGVGSGWKNAARVFLDRIRMGTPPSPTRRYVHSYRGLLQVLPVPDAGKLAAYSIAVAVNNHLSLHLEGGAEESPQPRHVAAVPVPERTGEPSPIKHIVYIIKENRTYDQFFGGLGKGNGDPSLESYGENVIPNHRRLARQFVLLDNFYATGGNSGDGHQWVTQANETEYTYLPGYRGRSYPYGGEDPMGYSQAGFIWTAAEQAHKSFIDFGEYAGNGQNAAHPEVKMTRSRAELLRAFDRGEHFPATFSALATATSLKKYLVPDFPAWTLDVPDVVRARIFCDHLKQWEQHDDMPDLVMAQLPSDHTEGTKPGASTPQAFMADNDYALGLIVEAISHSKFWPSTLIFVVEDDAQGGLDHVDGHRTVALAVSPYIKRGIIDSTFYSQTSMLKTIELVLGLHNLSIFDLIANDMRSSFQVKPDFTPYTAVKPEYSLYAVSPPLATLKGQARSDAKLSMGMNFKVADAVPSDKLNRILWRDVRGPNAAYPRVAQSLFAPSLSDPDDGDDH